MSRPENKIGKGRGGLGGCGSGPWSLWVWDRDGRCSEEGKRAVCVGGESAEKTRGVRSKVMWRALEGNAVCLWG
jgi:hypothetical protein